ncbi:MAG: TQO small subunit DoxD [Aggregatilineales bacterium]
MTTNALKSEPLVPARPVPGDLVGLVSAVLIIIAYLIFPLRSDGSETGFTFLSSSTTFPALTLVIGIVGIVTALVNMTALHERAARWYMLGLGVLGLIFLVDNALRGKAPLALGGTVAMIGCIGLIIQVVLPRPGSTSANRTSETIFGLVRVMVATLWFTQLLWKLPWANFGCAAGALVPAANTGGLCDWLGKEIASPRYPLYKDFLTGFISPNLSWLAFLIVGGEAFVCFSLMTGFLTRLGGLVGALMAINLFIGLTAVSGEWDWTYLMLPLVNAIFIIVGGRFIGLDALLYPRLHRMAEKGNPLAGLLARIVS